uniref:Putative helicase sen1 n=1 Tax=Tetraselmis sp. GSL018 TaxID=582737 RepID=A0A061S8P9_9CHLO
MKPPACLAGAGDPFQKVIQRLEAHRGLNASQMCVLKTAAGRSVTLVQGPPGTGKSRCIAAMVSCMCRVFCDSRARSLETAAGFRLPTLRPVGEWTPGMVCDWLCSWRVAGHSDESTGDTRLLPTEEEKETACMALKNLSGQGLLALSRKETILRARRSDQRPGVEAAAMESFACKVEAMKKRLVRAVDEDQRENSMARSLGRDYRILACADSNSAVNNLLQLLHNDRSFMAQGYTVLRLGGSTTVVDEALLQYSLDEQIKGSRLTAVCNSAIESLRNRANYKDILRSIQALLDELDKEQASLRREAERELSVSLRERLQELADTVIASAKSKVRECFVEFQDGRHDDRRPAARSCLNKVLREEVLDLASYRLIIGAQVVLSTNTAAGEIRKTCEKLGISFPIVLLDECGQSTESSSLIPLTHGAEWVLMGADLNQLPPTIRSSAAKANFDYHGKSGGSLYGRLARDLCIQEHTLYQQYRMHPKIRQFVADTWYPNIEPPLQESAGCSMLSARPPPRPTGKWSSFWWPNSKFPAAFFDVQDGFEQRPAYSTSYVNLREASVSIRLAVIMASAPTVKTIAILSPYSKQASMIRNKLQNASGILEQLAREGISHLKSLNAYTVDEFQGCEADVVIFTSVRSNGWSRSIGHTADFRRINVAISRAKQALVMVGNSSTLQWHSHVALEKGGKKVKNYWRDVILWMECHDAVVKSYHVDQSLCEDVQLPPQISEFGISDTDAGDNARPGSRSKYCGNPLLIGSNAI